MHLPTLISDLALILIVASITTLLFKKIKQPLVLGYIVAGMITGPYFSMFPNVADMANINVWSNIGIIILMFSLGLEFNLHKLARVGGTAIITTITEVTGMGIIGFFAGQLLGWSFMNSLFFGGIIAISSTTIIIKAFEDLKLKREKFAQVVFGILVMEDILAIFLMIILSTIAVSQNINGGTLLFNIAKMVFYLALWLILGIYLVPTLLKKTHRLMNDETLLIVALGMCLGMVLLANYIGFSSALGAFLAGSLLAGTIHGNRVERLITPVKDLFGAVFFISVGMMVDPILIYHYLPSILLITALVIIGKLIFPALGLMLSGQSLHLAIRSSFSLAQIGEFAFIIASLGLTLGVTADFLYPIVVAVSVITTFTTPFFIGHSEKFYQWLQKRLPENWLNKLNRYTSEEQSETEKDSDWQNYIKQCFSRMFVYVIIVLGINVVGISWLLPLVGQYLPQPFDKFAVTAVILIAMSPFLKPMLFYNRNYYFVSLWVKSKSNHLPLIVLIIIRFAITIGLVLTPLLTILSLPSLLLLAIAVAIVILINRSNWLIGRYLQFEAKFLANLNELHLQQRDGENAHDWLDQQLRVASFRCDHSYECVNKTLADLGWGAIYKVQVIKIIRGKRHINIPEGYEKLLGGDQIFIVGTERDINNIRIALPYLCNEDNCAIFPTLYQFITSQDQYEEEDQLLCYAVKVEKESGLAGVSIKDSQIKKRWNCYLLGLERNLYPILNPNPNMQLNTDDLIWVLGTQKMAKSLVQSDLI